MVGTFSRRDVIAGMGGMSTASIAGCMGSNDEEFPSDTVTVQIPYGPGGSFDAYVRLATDYLSDYFDNADFQASNVEGGGGVVSMEQLWRADPDGYTLKCMHTNSMIREQLMQDMDYDVREVEYLAQTRVDDQAIAVHADHDVSTWGEYVEAVQNGELRIGAQGGPLNITTMNYMIPGVAGELYSEQDILDTVVYYESTGGVMDAMLSGDVDTVSANYWGLISFAEDLDIVMVLRTEDESPRPDITPEAETLATADVPNAEEIEALQADTAIYIAPPETPEDNLDILREAFGDVLTDDEFQQEAEDNDLPITYEDTEGARDRAMTAYDSWEDRTDLLQELADHA